jgi:hypothetical protein
MDTDRQKLPNPSAWKRQKRSSTWKNGSLFNLQMNLSVYITQLSQWPPELSKLNERRCSRNVAGSNKFFLKHLHKITVISSCREIPAHQQFMGMSRWMMKSLFFRKDALAFQL